MCLADVLVRLVDLGNWHTVWHPSDALTNQPIYDIQEAHTAYHDQMNLLLLESLLFMALYLGPDTPRLAY